MIMGFSKSTISALRVRQWLDDWDDVNFDWREGQSRPEKHFYLFSVAAKDLRELSAIYRRDASTGEARKDDLGIQRRHEPTRSEEIRRYIREGFPASTLTAAQRNKNADENLKKPGWLPTAIVVNILKPGDQRNSKVLDGSKAIEVQSDDQTGFAKLVLPNDIDSEIPPIEVIDGQHRLFAFDESLEDSGFELPVVAFHGLDVSWQAYLFWTINIKPKKINPSLAFDLYPLLREQEWLERGDRLVVYRETRAQELTEALWSTPGSPWFRRINMLGGRRKENGPVTQASFIRSLTASMVKPWEPKGNQRIGGIFGGTPNRNEGLEWSRFQQAEFLITAWKLLAEAVNTSKSEWAEETRQLGDPALLSERAEPLVMSSSRDDSLELVNGVPLFKSELLLLSTDQGVRGFQHIVNDVCYVCADELRLADWRGRGNLPDITPENLADSAIEIPETIHKLLSEIAASLSSFDWRTSNFPELHPDLRRQKAAFRGSGGYKELRDQLVDHLAETADGMVSWAAHEVKGNRRP